MSFVIRAAKVAAALAALGIGLTVAGGDAMAAKRYCRQEHCAKREPVVCRSAPGRRVCTGGRCLQTGVRIVECGR